MTYTKISVVAVSIDESTVSYSYGCLWSKMEDMNIGESVEVLKFGKNLKRRHTPRVIGIQRQ